MATSKEQHDARQHAVSTGSVQRGPVRPGQVGRAAAPGAAAESALGEPADAEREFAAGQSRQDAGQGDVRGGSRPADPDVPSSDEP